MLINNHYCFCSFYIITLIIIVTSHFSQVPLFVRFGLRNYFGILECPGFRTFFKVQSDPVDDDYFDMSDIFDLLTNTLVSVRITKLWISLKQHDINPSFEESKGIFPFLWLLLDYFCEYNRLIYAFMNNYHDFYLKRKNQRMQFLRLPRSL